MGAAELTGQDACLEIEESTPTHEIKTSGLSSGLSIIFQLFDADGRGFGYDISAVVRDFKRKISVTGQADIIRDDFQRIVLPLK